MIDAEVLIERVIRDLLSMHQTEVQEVISTLLDFYPTKEPARSMRAETLRLGPQKYLHGVTCGACGASDVWVSSNTWRSVMACKSCGGL